MNSFLVCCRILAISLCVPWDEKCWKLLSYSDGISIFMLNISSKFEFVIIQVWIALLLQAKKKKERFFKFSLPLFGTMENGVGGAATLKEAAITIVSNTRDCSNFPPTTVKSQSPLLFLSPTVLPFFLSLLSNLTTFYLKLLNGDQSIL